MRCESPKSIGGDSDPHHKVPCGKCPACRERVPLEWALRLRLESSLWATSLFVTLTYSQERLARSRDDIKRHLKHLARHLPRSMRYAVFGERGGLRLRKHYHALIWSNADMFSVEAAVRAAWPFGNVDVKDGSQAARYVSKYATSDQVEKDIQEFYSDNLGPNARKTSRPGIGYFYAVALARKFHTDEAYRAHVELFHDIPSTTRVDGHLVRLPRYIVQHARRLIGLPSFSPQRESVQTIRRAEAAADVRYRELSERKRVTLAARSRVLSSRDLARRNYLDPQRVPAERRMRAAVLAGEYETRAARRARLRRERERSRFAVMSPASVEIPAEAVDLADDLGLLTRPRSGS